jgi:fatty acid CoA ligase FadD28
MQVIDTSVPAVLRERASLQPNATAFTFIDYEQNWDGVGETLGRDADTGDRRAGR